MIHAIFTRSSISFEQHIDVYIIMNETSEVMDKFEGENYAQLLHDSLKLKQEQPDEPWVLGTQDQEEFITLADRIHYTITSMLMEKAGTNNIGLTLNTTYARRVIASGQNYDDFIERIRQYDSGTICSNVWWKDTIAYRCNTCAYNVCICDCGDEDVMSRAGFCAKHGKAESEQIMPPEELTVMSEVVITKILLRILNEFRGYGRLKSLERTRILASCVTEYVSDEIAKNCETFISFLQELAQVNPFSKIIAKIFVDPKIYKRISDYVTALSAGQQPLVSIAELIMLAGKDDSSTMNELKPLSVDEYLKEVDFLPFDQPEFECLLDEFMFYNIRLGIPQELNNFLLALLANERYKYRFAINFFKHYDLIESLVANITIEGTPINTHVLIQVVHRAIHASVQICSSKSLCVYLEEKIQVLRHVMESGLRLLYYKALNLNAITSSTNGSSWKTLNVDENPFFLKNAVWGMSTDLQNLLIHKELANEILTNEALAKRYILLLSSLQAVNVQVRKVSGDHIEHDQNVVAIQRCFTTEWDISSTFLLNCVASLTKEDNEKMRFFSRLLIERLKTFFTASGPRDRYLTSLSCFFHLPLLRQLSSLELQFFSTNGCCELISPDDQEFVLMHSFIYPLRIQATIAEYQAGMWIRSGNAIRASIIVYQQMGFSHGFLDFDFSIMRIAASKLDPDRITEMLFDAFHVQECLNYPFDVEELDSSVPLTVRRRSWVANLIDGYLKLLLELILVQTFAELKNEEVQKEIIQSIISEDEPVYSKIRAGKTEHRVTDEEFNQMLNNVATFVEPDRSNTNRQGHYELKKDVWKQLCLVRARHRSCSPQEYNTILNRMEQALTAFMPRNEDKRHIWPLYSLPNFDDEAPIINTTRILPNERNIFVCQFVLEWFLSHDAPLHLLQQAIFVLTLMFKFTKSKRAQSLKTSDWDLRHFDIFGAPENELSFETNCANFYKRFTTRPTNVLFEKMKKPLSILELLIQTFTKLHLNEFPSHNEYTARKQLKEHCQQTLSEMDRLIGTGSDYVARTIAWLYCCDKTSKEFLDNEVFTHPTEPTTETSNEIQKKRLVAKQKQMEILKMQQKKQSALMEKLMASEGMDDEPTEETEIQYGECSICNSREHGAGKWFGVLTAIQSTSVEAGSVHGDNETYQMWEQAAIPTFLAKRSQYCSTFKLIPYAELKTCGHFVHLDCFAAYEDSPLSRSSPISFSISCPVCRGNVHAVIPLLPSGQLLPSVKLGSQMDSGHSKYELKSFESEIEEFRQALNSTTEIRSTLTNHYKDFGKKCAFFVQSIASDILSRVFESLSHENPMFISLSLIKNWIDRICLMQIEEVEFPQRLHQKVTKPLYFSSIFNVDSKSCAEILLDFYDHLTLNRWSNKKSNSRVLPILHYDSQTVITIMASNLILCNDSTTADQLGYFRVLYSYTLFHCFSRTVVLELLRKPNHQRLNFLQLLYGKMKDDVFGISKALQWMETIEKETGVLRSTTTYWQCSENENEITPNQFIEDLKQLLYRFAHFSLNLAIELELFPVDQMAKWNTRMSFEEAFHFFNDSILGEALQLDQICLLVNGHSNRLHLWITSFTQNLGVELKSYYANNGLWTHRKIMNLPNSYETLFNENFGRQCTRCSTVPTQPMICLLCGQLTCLDSCCFSNYTFSGHQVSEVEKHAYSCGSACGIFLCLTSGVVVITHGPLANIFGSIYLDAHGEEDRNLRRGRPLRLSTVRLRRLNDLWISHDFDRNVNNSQGWLLFEHLSSVLRECHNML